MSAIPYASTPYWLEAVPLSRHDEAPFLPSVDVAIVGAGFAGMSAALHLARAGRSVQVFDRQRPGEGASSRNGGISSGNIRPSLETLRRQHGTERAAAIVAEGAAARQWLHDFIDAERIDADLQRVGRFSGAMSPKDYDRQARATEAVARAYGVTAYAVPRGEVGNYIATDLYAGGVVRMDIHGLQPAKFHGGLLAKAVEAGAVIQGCCRVESVTGQGEGYLVRTERGDCRAREVIVTTNGYTDAFDRWLRQRLVPVRSRMIATVPLGREAVRRLVPKLMMLTDSRELSYYYRPSPDGERLLFGGRDGSIVGNPSAPTEHLRRELARVFPSLERVELSHSWFGYVAMNRDMVPRVFSRQGKHYGVGFCGSGIVWAPWVGRKIARAVLGETDAGTAFEFRPPGLVPTIAGHAWFMPLIVAFKAWQDRRPKR